MKVKELKELLDTVDDNAEVFIEDKDAFTEELELKPAIAAKCMVEVQIIDGIPHRTVFKGSSKNLSKYIEGIRII